MRHRKVEELYWQVGGELQRMSEELSGSRPRVAAGKAWEPRVDVVEDERRFVVKAEIAGVRGDDISLVYMPRRHSLILRGVRPEMEYSEGERTAVHQLEILVGEFEREVTLPDTPIDPARIRAQYRNGFLIVVVPKMERQP